MPRPPSQAQLDGIRPPHKRNFYCARSFDVQLGIINYGHHYNNSSVLSRTRASFAIVNFFCIRPLNSFAIMLLGAATLRMGQVIRTVLNYGFRVMLITFACNRVLRNYLWTATGICGVPTGGENILLISDSFSLVFCIVLSLASVVRRRLPRPPWPNKSSSDHVSHTQTAQALGQCIREK